MKTARFKEVVARAGRPTLHLAWSDPALDPDLRRAEAAHRVMTVHQHFRGGRKDYAEVGVAPGPGVQYLIFPKSLRSFAERHVVGVDYDLFESAATSGGPPPRPAKAPDKPKIKAPRKPEPAAAPDEPEPRTLTVEDLKHEVARALGELRRGDAAGAKRRLAALLDHP